MSTGVKQAEASSPPMVFQLEVYLQAVVWWRWWWEPPAPERDCLSGGKDGARIIFLNFDVAIIYNRAQHLLAIARKVEQGGVNG
jgi:hypothetical protein